MAASELWPAFERMIESPDYPCVGAKSALAKDTVTFFEGTAIDRAADDLPLYEALCAFGNEAPDAAQDDADDAGFRTFVAAFGGPRTLSEKAFETALWDRLQALHNIDMAHGAGWAPETESNPSSPHFGMSVGGRAWFVVGIHPHASRAARRCDFPMMVFNLHEQFEALREQGQYQRLKSVVRDRDRNLEGDINPMLDDFGGSSEARQYSGRPVRDDWSCPLAIRRPLGDDA